MKYEGDFRDGKVWGHGKERFSRPFYVAVIIFYKVSLVISQKYFLFKIGIAWNSMCLGLLTFADGTHGLPRNEGYFEGGTIVRREKCPTAYHRAVQAAEKARSQAL